MKAENFLNCKDLQDEKNMGMIYINRNVRVDWSKNATELYSGGSWFEFRLDHLLTLTKEFYGFHQSLQANARRAPPLGNARFFQNLSYYLSLILPFGAMQYGHWKCHKMAHNSSLYIYSVWGPRKRQLKDREPDDRTYEKN
jgi:hypothetical protein